MTAQIKRMDVTLETLFDSVDLAEDITLGVAEAAGFDEEGRYRIAMAVREAVINAVEYGNCFAPDKRIFLALELMPDKLVIHVRDEGAGFELADVPDPLREENLLKPCGRGILLIRAFMDEFELRRPAAGGAEVVIAKRYPEAPPGSSQSGSGPRKLRTKEG